MKFFISLSFFVILAVVGKIHILEQINFLITSTMKLCSLGNETNCDPCTDITEKISNYWKTNMSERFGFCSEISEIQVLLQF